MWGRRVVLAIAVSYFAPACSGESEPGADGGAPCTDDYVLLLLGVNDEATGFTVLEDGAELSAGLSPTGLWMTTLAARVRAPNPAQTTVRVELLIDAIPISEWEIDGDALGESPLGLATEVWLIFLEDPAAYYGMSGRLRGEVSDRCGLSSTVDLSIVLTDNL